VRGRERVTGGRVAGRGVPHGRRGREGEREREDGSRGTGAPAGERERHAAWPQRRRWNTNVSAPAAPSTATRTRHHPPMLNLEPLHAVVAGAERADHARAGGQPVPVLRHVAVDHEDGGVHRSAVRRREVQRPAVHTADGNGERALARGPPVPTVLRRLGRGEIVRRRRPADAVMAGRERGGEQPEGRERAQARAWE